jgi:hypothetical protein
MHTHFVSSAHLPLAKANNLKAFRWRAHQEAGELSHSMMVAIVFQSLTMAPFVFSSLGNFRTLRVIGRLPEGGETQEPRLVY